MAKRRAPAPTPYPERGELIRRARDELGLSQEAVAEIIGVHYQNYRKWEQGGSLREEFLAPLSRALSLPLAELVPQAGELAEPPPRALTEAEALVLEPLARLDAAGQHAAWQLVRLLALYRRAPEDFAALSGLRPEDAARAATLFRALFDR